MKYLAISNEGAVDPRVFTMLGVSSAREDNSKIGQFGSGSKHGMLIALRSNIHCVVTSGNITLEPVAEEVVIQNKLYRRVSYKLSTVLPNGRIEESVEPSNMTLDFGSLDWNGAYMMIREFISNALDAVNQDWGRVEVSVTDTIVTSPDKTTVHLELTQEVAQIYSRIEEYFLHVSGKQNERVIEKAADSVARIYRMGVFVTENEQHSLFDYNGDHTMKIDECRNMETYSVTTLAGKIFYSLPVEKQVALAKKIILTGFNGVERLEHKFPVYYINHRILEKALLELYGASMVYADSPLMAEYCGKRGYTVKVFPSFMSSWYMSLTYTSLQRAEKILDKNIVDMKGVEKLNVTVPLVDKVIEALHKMGFINKHIKKPQVLCFQELIIDGEKALGYTDGKDIYLQWEQKGNIVTILEEVLHLYTEEKDCTRGFQDILVRVAGFLLEKRLRRGVVNNGAISRVG